MAAATSAVNTPMKHGEIVEYPVAASTALYAGTLICLDSSGNAVNAADTAGLRVIGRAESDVDNSAGAAGDLKVQIRRAVFRFANSGTNAVDADDKGKICFVEDNQTVAETSTNKVIAGRVHDVDTDGVWVDVTEFATRIPAVYVLTSTNGTMAAAADLAAVKVEGEKIGDDVRALHALLVAHGLIA